MTSIDLHTSRALAGNAAAPTALPRSQRIALIGAKFLGLALLGGCGGGGAVAPVAELVAQDANISAANTVTKLPDRLANPAVLSPFTPSAPDAIIAGPVLTDFEIENEGTAQTNVPFTFGQVIAPGQLGKDEGLAARLTNGTVLFLQTDVKASHADGSVRHVIISGILPKLAAGQIEKIQLVKSRLSKQSGMTLQDLAQSGLSSNVAATLGGVRYSATLAQALVAPKPVIWLSGAVANEWIVSTPLKAADGSSHPQLSASFAVRWYPGLSKQARVDVTLENAKTFQSGAYVLDYDVAIDVGGRSVYAKTGLKHYHRARWHQSAWWNGASAPSIHVRPNVAYLIASKAVSNYDQTSKPSEGLLATFAKSLNANNTGPMTIGPVVAYMGTTGGRGDIGPLPIWSVSYLLSLDKRARDAMMAAAEGSGSWSIHYRDESTGQPLRVDNEANKNVTTHGNLLNVGPLPAPRFAATPYSPDVAHQPSLAYLPYLLTGDYYYLEELQFWAAWNPLGTDPGNSGRGKGLLRWHQVRGQAWALRTLGHAAYITPDAHPLKDYFTKQLDNNMAFYHDTYVVGNPNQLGIYDGSGASAFQIGGSAPWQDDYLTWSFGYLAELGFEKAQPILQWKAKYPVGRMTTPGFCWIKASAYSLKIRDDAKSPVYDSLEKVYLANFSGESIANEGGVAKHPQGLRFIDQPCASQAMANWFNASSNFIWGPRRMDGYADSTLGYPANLQPALAVAATAGIPNAREAWSLFSSR
ncbi:MAG: hypothetical protein RR983_12160, partial [Massilia sp.]